MSSKVDPTTDNRPGERFCAGQIALSVVWCTVDTRSEPAELEGDSAMTVSAEPTSAHVREQEPTEALRPHAEDAFADELAALAARAKDGAGRAPPRGAHAFADELAALAAQDDPPRPARWKLSPWAVAT